MWSASRESLAEKLTSSSSSTQHQQQREEAAQGTEEADTMGRTRKVAPNNGNSSTSSNKPSKLVENPTQPSPRNASGGGSGGGGVAKYYCRACNELFPNWSQCLNHVRTAEVDNDPDLFKLTTTTDGRRELQKISKYVSGGEPVTPTASSGQNTPAATPPVTPRNALRTPTPTGSNGSFFPPNASSFSRPEVTSAASTASPETRPSAGLPPPPPTLSSQAPLSQANLFIPKPERLAPATSNSISTSSVRFEVPPSPSSAQDHAGTQNHDLRASHFGKPFTASAHHHHHHRDADNQEQSRGGTQDETALTAATSAAAAAAARAADGQRVAGALLTTTMRAGGFAPLHSPASAASMDPEDYVSVGTISSVTATPETTPQSSPLGDDRVFEFGDPMAPTTRTLPPGLMIPASVALPGMGQGTVSPSSITSSSPSAATAAPGTPMSASPTAAGTASLGVKPKAIAGSSSADAANMTMTSSGSFPGSTTGAFTPSVPLVLNQGSAPGYALRAQQARTKRAPGPYAALAPPGFRTSSSLATARNKSSPTNQLIDARTSVAYPDAADAPNPATGKGESATWLSAADHKQQETQSISGLPQGVRLVPVSSSSTKASRAARVRAPTQLARPIPRLWTLPDAVAARICEYIDLEDCASLSQAILLD